MKLQDILNGNIFSSNWLKRQYRLIALIVFLIVLYVYAGYRAEQQHKYLGELQDELQDAEYELLTLQSELTDLTRQSTVAEELEKRGSALKTNTIPAIQIQP
ncbi:MAG: hypothetical protein K5660_03550 [Paludibacteraceae bacterium]|nr:hypothetical protein [Paludibacteraceae bacterium]